VPAGASLNLTDFCKKFGGGAAPPALGNAREYNIDLIPKCVDPLPLPHLMPSPPRLLSIRDCCRPCAASISHRPIAHTHSLRPSLHTGSPASLLPHTLALPRRYIMADGDLIKMLVKADVNKCASAASLHGITNGNHGRDGQSLAASPLPASVVS
jgi:hypothetical protein